MYSEIFDETNLSYKLTYNEVWRNIMFLENAHFVFRYLITQLLPLIVSKSIDGEKRICESRTQIGWKCALLVVLIADVIELLSLSRLFYSDDSESLWGGW